MRRALALSLALLACGPASGERAERGGPSAGDEDERAPAEPPPPPGPEWARADDRLAARMRELAARAEVHGALPERALEQRAFVAARGTRAFELEVPAATCWAIVAFASGGMRDLDARLFTPEGELLAEDVAPDPRPAILACADEGVPLRAWLVLDAYDGSGAVLIAALRTPREALDAVRELLGGEPGVALGGSARDPLDEALARRGFEPTGPPIEVPLARGQRVRVPLRARAGRCYAIVARAREPALRVALRLLDLAGEPLRDAGVEGALQVCEPEDVERAIEVAAREGAGTARVTIAEGDDAAVGGEAGLWLGTPAE